MENISLKNVKVINVTSASKIADIAEDKGINPQEVFVRVTFETEDSSQYTVSNKLRFITEKGYKQLLEAKEKGIGIDISVSETGFFYIERDVNVSDLFKEKVVVKDTRKNLVDLFRKN